MNQDEINSRLESSDGLGLVLNAVRLESGTRFKRFALLRKKTPDKAALHSGHYLRENPSYVREQKIIQSKPYELSLYTSADVPELMDLVFVYFSDLDEVNLFLQQFDQKVTDLHPLSDEEMEL